MFLTTVQESLMSTSRFTTLRLATAAAVLALTGTAWAAPGTAQTEMQAQHMAHRSDHGDKQMSPERQQRMAQKMAERQNKLKQVLQITAAQEPAWNAFVASMAPPAGGMQRPNRDEMAKLTTPQRLERMQAMKAQHDQHMAARVEATKRFYSALTPEQQKRFDVESHRFMGHGKGDKGGDGGRKGYHHG